MKTCTGCGHTSTDLIWKSYDNRCPMCGCTIYEGKENKPYGGIFSSYNVGGVTNNLVMSGIWNIDDLAEMGKKVEDYIKQKKHAEYYGWRHG